MLDSNDISTVRALRLLSDEIQRNNRPITFWVGAGASSWCGYPRWPELAERFHSDFVRYEPGYDTNRGLDLLNNGDFPGLFQVCQDTSRHGFYRLLSTCFAAKEPTAVYLRFAAAIAAVTPVSLLTTNVDELLEKCLPGVSTVNRSDVERALFLLDRNQPFVCKLHGSISDIQSTVFTSEDYDRLFADARYLALLKRILSRTSVVFVGYGLQDDYLLSLLQQNHSLAELFGDGPHFAILSSAPAVLPSSVRVIRYTPEPHRDHRSSITVLEEIRSLRSEQPEFVHPPAEETAAQTRSRSAHLLFYILPPGTWTTSQTVNLKDSTGAEKQLITGTGFTDEELPVNRSTAMHDLIVGLLCFDQVVAPIQALSAVHNLLGAERFWALVHEDVLVFVSWSDQIGVIFPSADSISAGDLGSFELHNPDFTKRNVGEIIRKQLNPVPGNEEEAEKLFSDLEARIREIKESEEGSIPHMVRGLLLRPSIRQLLGMSGGTPLNSLPRWQVFPVLRLANAVKIGAACRILGIGSAKLDFGISKLAGPAFATAGGREWADDTASYVVCGRFAADVGELAMQDPSIVDAVHSFRDTQAGESLRREVFSRLASSEGAEVNIAINSGLREAIPMSALQAARDEFVKLLLPNLPGGAPPPAIWNDKRYADDAIARWRKVSRKILDNYCQRSGVNPYSECPCGSGEKLKFCCDEALRQ